MKTYQALILFILISYIYSKSFCDTSKLSSGTPSKADDCNKGDNDGGHCCLVKYSAGNSCLGFGSNEYKYISDYVKYMKKCYPKSDDDCEKNDNFSIECKSSYLVFSSLLLILLFL